MVICRTMIVIGTVYSYWSDYVYSRYGVWLLSGLCMPDEPDSGLEMAGLLSMLFEWYKVIQVNNHKIREIRGKNSFDILKAIRQYQRINHDLTSSIFL